MSSAEEPEAGTPPAWTVNCSARAAFLRGLRSAPLAPGIILFFAMIGFGALARDAGFTVGQAVFITLTVFQLPGQVALVDQVGRNATLAAAAFAVLLTAIRLLPMTVVLMPYLRGSGLPRWLEYAGSHFVAITAWVESLRRLPPLPQNVRLPYYFGYASVLCTGTIIATYAGYHLAGVVPPAASAALLFLTPIYFVLSLIAAAVGWTDRLAILFGTALGPPLFLVVPGLDLLATGLIGGTAAYLAGRKTDARARMTSGGKEGS
ncbi:MAG: AzlC family ABC transporter permease [Hyphomicrobiaceae bacterium]